MRPHHDRNSEPPERPAASAALFAALFAPVRLPQLPTGSWRAEGWSSRWRVCLSIVVAILLRPPLSLIPGPAAVCGQLRRQSGEEGCVGERKGWEMQVRAEEGREGPERMKGGRETGRVAGEEEGWQTKV